MHEQKQCLKQLLTVWIFFRASEIALVNSSRRLETGGLLTIDGFGGTGGLRTNSVSMWEFESFGDEERESSGIETAIWIRWLVSKAIVI